MYNLKDVTFLIPVRIDQPDRLRNFYITLRYLKKYLDTNIIVGETGYKQYNNGELEKSIPQGCSYVFIHEDCKYFNRMKTLNILSNSVKTKVVVLQDIDVLLYPDQYIEATGKIISLGCELVYPYDGNFYNIPEGFIAGISANLDVRGIDPKDCINMRPKGDSVGGVLFWDLKKFRECGGCNERIISWGFDDTEMYERAQILGVKIDRCKKGLFHLFHKPSLNSLNGNHEHYTRNRYEWFRIKNLNRGHLIAYIKTWGYVENA